MSNPLKGYHPLPCPFPDGGECNCQPDLRSESASPSGSALGHVINAIDALECGMNPVPEERVLLALNEMRAARTAIVQNDKLCREAGQGDSR